MTAALYIADHDLAACWNAYCNAGFRGTAPISIRFVAAIGQETKPATIDPPLRRARLRLEMGLLAAARLRHVAGTSWSTKRYLNMQLLRDAKHESNVTA
jgi:hypothetical protein